MNKATMDFLLAHGYKKVSKDDIKNVLPQGNIKYLHIEVSLAEPSMLLSRVREKDVVVSYDRMDEKYPERLVIDGADRYRTKLFNVPLDNIKDVIINISNGVTDIMFNLSTDSNNYRILLEQ